MFNKLFKKYYNYINIFDKLKISILFLYYFYNYKLKFAKKVNKNTLFKNRIYFLLNYKFVL